MTRIKPKKVIVLGMELDEWQYKSCIAHFGVEDNFATLYDIESEEKGKGHATKLLQMAKKYYKGKKFGGTVALNFIMAHIYRKLKIKEYK
jgi:hypothetical protein